MYYPRPQLVRNNWMSLNGEWNFLFDFNNEGEINKWYNKFPSQNILKINVPFTYETKLSGIEKQESCNNVWYQRNFTVECHDGFKPILNFEGVDYICKVWINGIFVGTHKGAYTSFSFDIGKYINYSEENSIVVKVEDSFDCSQPRGKQRWRDENFGCWYVQTTGIWKTVWLEYVTDTYIENVKLTPNIDTREIEIECNILGDIKSNLKLSVHITFNEKDIVKQTINVDKDKLAFKLNLATSSDPWSLNLWYPQSPNLYDIKFTLLDDNVLDIVTSYFGMRKISIKDGLILLNNEPIYQRLLLDQGYWQDSHLTPPSEEAIIEDIKLTLAAGYNGVRKHQKIEDKRFLYHCDKMGLLVWSEMGATYEFSDKAIQNFTEEWLEIVKQNYNHPCIVTWVPFNESWGVDKIFTNVKQQKFTEAIYYLTKSIDPYRPVIVNDGWEHTISDIITLHDYVERGEEFTARYSDKDKILGNVIPHCLSRYAFTPGYEYKGQPIIISEYGGIAFNNGEGWGYGNQVKTEEEFLERFDSITTAIKQMKYVCGYCYTQTTDVQQEINGLYTEDRKPKVNIERIREINLK